MHTTICAFDDKARAEEARDRLVRAGFDADDLHIEQGHVREEAADANDRWDGLEREVAVDRKVLASFGHFFARLLGRNHISGHVNTYAQHIERGKYVLVADARDESEAERARAMLHELQGGDLNVVHRPEQLPLRDIVGLRQAEPHTEDRSRETVTGSGASSPERDRATASAVVRPDTGPELRDPDLEHAPGLRYADKDKPL